jgi:uncharacterized protein (DUF885 family)
MRHALIASLGLIVALPALAQSDDETARLDAWFETRFEEQLDFSPIQKTLLGRKDDYDRIDRYSEAALDERLAWGRAARADLESSFDRSRLTPEGQMSFDLWIYQQERGEAALEFRRRGYLFHQMGGQHTDLPRTLITAHAVDDEADMVAYVSRVGEIGRAIRELTARAELAAGEGVHAPRFAYQAVIEQARAVISGTPFDPAATVSSPLWADANAKIDALLGKGAIHSARAESLRNATATALREQLAPAYRELISWAESELPETEDIATGIWRLPQGAAYYEERLASMTTTDMTADEIHELGLAEVARISAEMESIRTAVGFEGDLDEFFAFVRDDPRFYYANTDEGRQAYLDKARQDLAFITALLPDWFGLLPKAPLEVRRVEPFREVAGQAQHYQRGSPDGSRPGIYYSHLIDMSAMPIPTLEATAYHEGLPGHHMQLSVAQELTGLPTFRTVAGFMAFSEGWGLYAEALAKEMGAYQDPYSDFGRLTNEIWRALRLVVDTGLHAQRWTEDQAVEYMLANSAIAEGQVRAEVRRYIVMPGQATSYKIGMLKIQELRASAEQAQGDDFDIRAFHDVVLGSAGLPLTLLERRVDEWLATTTATASGSASGQASIQ